MKKFYLLITLLVLGSAHCMYSMELTALRNMAKQIEEQQKKDSERMTALKQRLGIPSTSRALVPFKPQPAPSAAPAQPEIKRASAAQQLDLLDDAQPTRSAAPTSWSTPIGKAKSAVRKKSNSEKEPEQKTEMAEITAVAAPVDPQPATLLLPKY